MLISVMLCLVLFLALLGGLEVGRWWYSRRRKAQTDDGDAESAAGDSVVFAVVGLLIAFTINTAANRFDERRHQIVQQANGLGTAWMRLDILPEADRPAIRDCMRRWLVVALDVAHRSMGQADFSARFEEAQQLQNEAWRLAVAATERSPKPNAAQLVLPPLNDWIDLTTMRLEMKDMGLPSLIFPSLVGMALIGAVLAGHGMAKSRRRSWLHMIAFAGTISFSMYVILDLNNPREGFNRVDSVDRALSDLSKSFRSDSKSSE